MSKLKTSIEDQEFNYVVITRDNPVLPYGTKLRLDGGFYTNKDETIIFKSTNYTGSIIRKQK